MKDLFSPKIKNGIFCLLFLVINIQLFAQDSNISISRMVNDDNSIDLNYEKKLPGTYHVILEFSKVYNCDIKRYECDIKGHNGSLLTLRPSNSKSGISYALNHFSILGVSNPKVDSLFQYSLPFKSGNKQKIYEAGNIGEKYFGSEKPTNWKSYIINFKNLDTIFCMRKGIVVRLIDVFEDDSSIDKQYTSKRNSITIEHEDGTFSDYVGFKKNSFKVKLGQTVYPQTQLGIVELYNKSENNYRLDFYIRYLSKIDFEKKDMMDMFKNSNSLYTFLTPHFFTAEGVITVESSKEYSASFNEAMLLQEMTRSEKKKYLKDPTPFK